MLDKRIEIRTQAKALDPRMLGSPVRLLISDRKLDQPKGEVCYRNSFTKATFLFFISNSFAQKL